MRFAIRTRALATCAAQRCPLMGVQHVQPRTSVNEAPANFKVAVLSGIVQWSLAERVLSMHASSEIEAALCRILAPDLSSPVQYRLRP